MKRKLNRKQVLSLVLSAEMCLTGIPTQVLAESENNIVHEQGVSEEGDNHDIDLNEGEEAVEETTEATTAEETTAIIEAEKENEIKSPEAKKQNEGNFVDSQVLAVQEMIDALPTLSVVSKDDYDKVQDAYDAFEALTEEQKAQIIGSEVFEGLFKWFNSQITSVGDTVATVEKSDGSSQDFEEISEAFEYAKENVNSKLKIKNNITCDDIVIDGGKFSIDATGYTFDGKIKINNEDADITILNGNFLKSGTEYSIVVNAGKLTIENGTFGHMISQGHSNIFPSIFIKGGEFNALSVSLVKESEISGGTFDALEVVSNITYGDTNSLYIKNNLKISGGKFKIIIYKDSSDKELYIDALLEDGKAFYNSGTSKWISPKTLVGYNDSYYAEVLEAPIKSFTEKALPSDIVYDDSISFGIDSVTVGSSYSADDITYSWKDKDGSTLSGETEKTLDITVPDTTSQKYTCEFALDGYVVTKTWEYDVSRATPTVGSGVVNATYGQVIGDINLNSIMSKATFKGSDISGTYSWNESTSTPVGDVGINTFHFNFTPTENLKFESILNQPISVNVSKANATIDVLPTEGTYLVYNGADIPLIDISSAQATGGELKYAVSETEPTDDSAYSVDVPTEVNAGNYKVWVKAFGDSNHNNSAAQSINVTIEQRDLSVLDPDYGIVLEDENTYNGNNLTQKIRTVEYWGDYLSTSDYTVSGDVQKDAGEYDITITGVGNYKGSFSKKYNIKPLPVVIDWGTTVIEYDGTPKSVSAEVSNKIGSDVVNVTLGGNYSGTEVGDYTAEVLTVDNSNYTTVGGTNLFVNWKISMANSSVSVLPTAVSGLVYNGSGQELVSGGTANGGTLKYAVSESEPTDDSLYGENIPKATNAGNYKVWVKAFGDSNHENSTASSIEVAISKLPVVITWSGTEVAKSYDGTPKSVSAEVLNKIGSDVVNVTLGGDYTATDAGDYIAEVSAVDNDNYTLTCGTELTANWKIWAVDSSINVLPTAVSGLVYNGNEQELVSGGTANGGTLKYAVSETEPTDDSLYGESIPKATNAGNYKVWVKVFGDSNHNNSIAKSVDVAISKLPVVITWSGTEVPENYDGTPKSVSAEVLNKIGSDVVNVTLGGDYIATDAGDYTAEVSAVDNDNYTLTGGTELTANWKISKANSSVSVLPTAVSGLVYNGSGQELVSGGTANGGTLKYAVSETEPTDDSLYGENIPKATNAGSYKVWFKIFGDKNHNNSTAESVDVAVSKLPVVITWSGTEVPENYDGTPKSVSAEVSNKIGSDVVNVTLGRDYTATDAGDYTAEVSAVDNDNYTLTDGTEITAIWKILKADSSFEQKPQAISNIIYNGDSQIIVSQGAFNGGTLKYAISETEPTDDSAYGEEIAKAKDAGSYKVWFKIFGDKNHNDSTAESIDVAISKHPVEIIWEVDQSYHYDGKEKAVSARIGNMCVGDTVNVIFGGTYKATDAGDYTATISALDNNNYTLDGVAVEELSKAWKILPTELSFTEYPSNISNSVYNGESRELVSGWKTNAGTIKYAVSESEPADDSLYSEQIPKAKDAGKYKVWAKVFGDKKNYIDSIASGYEVEIFKLPVKIVWSGTEGLLYDGTEKSVSAEVSNKVSNDVVNVTLGGTFKATERGKYNAEVSALDNDNYTLEGGEDISRYWTIFSKVTDYTAPTAVSGLIYNANNQNLVSAGITKDGETMEYSLDGENFQAKIPEGLNAGDYDVWFRVVGDYLATDPVKITSTIGKAKPLGNLGDKVSAKIKKGNLLSSANVKNEGILGVDGVTVLSGELVWVDGTKTINEECEEEMIFTPEDSNYEAIQGAVPVGIYSSSSSGSVKRTYAVRFESNGGSKVSGQQVDENDTAREPEDPTKDGYSFGGWFVDKSLSEKYDFSNIVRDTLTLYAKWKDADDDDNNGGDDKSGSDEDEKDKSGDDNGGSDKDGKDKTDQEEIIDEDWKNPFVDVTKQDWFYEDVKFTYQNGLMFGTSTDKFSPKMPITRAMFVTILYRAAGEPEVVKGYTFDDIGEGLYYTNAIGWAKKYQIVKGISPTEFAPNRNIKREEIAAIMHRYAKHMGYDVSVGESTNILSYSDYEKISGYAIESMQYAVGSGMIVGKSESTLNPLDSATRAEIAAIIKRFVLSMLSK